MIIDGFYLDIKGTLNDGIQRAIVEHPIPFVDGDLQEDMGMKSRRVSFTCVFWGKEGERSAGAKSGAKPSYYATAAAFIDHIRSNRVFVMQHPVNGQMAGVIEEASITYNDDLQQYAEVQVSFVEETPPAISNQSRNIKIDLEQQYRLTIDQGRLKVAKDLRAELGTEAIDILSRPLDPTKSISENFKNASAAVQKVARDLDQNLQRFQRLAANVTGLASDVIQTIDWAQTLDDRILNSVASLVSTYAVMFQKLFGAPKATAVADAIRVAAKVTTNALVADAILAIGAARLNIAVADDLTSDGDNRERLAAYEQSQPLTQNGGLVARASLVPSVLSSTDIENTLASVRSLASDALTAEPDFTAIKTGSQRLLIFAEKKILETAKIKITNVHGIFPDGFTPMHLICLNEGLSYRVAERLFKANKFSNPTFANGFVKVYEKRNG